MDGSGAKASELRYKPYGETRYSGLPAGTGTDYRFTGQRQLAGLGLYQMGVRWVDPYLNRWIQPDTIIPDPSNPQSLNRYMYCLGNPLRYIDPSGHWDEEWAKRFEQDHGYAPTDQDWWDYQFSLQFDEWIAGFWDYTASLRALLWTADVTLQRGDIGWRLAQAELVGEAVRGIGDRFGGDARRLIGGITIILQQEVKPWFTKLYDPRGDYLAFQHSGKVYMEPDANLAAVVHEMGHYFAEKNDLLAEYWKRVRAFAVIPNRSEDFAEAFRFYVLTVVGWPPPGEWACSSQGCKYPMDRARFDYFEQFQR